MDGSFFSRRGVAWDVLKSIVPKIHTFLCLKLRISFVLFRSFSRQKGHFGQNVEFGKCLELELIPLKQQFKADICTLLSTSRPLKLSQFFSAMGNMAKRLDQAGADALVLFNRFYQPDIDIQELEVKPSLGLSSAGEIRLPLLWIAILHGKLNASLAATRGVENPDEVIKYLLAGADAVMTTSALLRHGPAYTNTLVEGLKAWMEARKFSSVNQVRGSMSRANVANPAAFERANYIRVLESYQSAYI